MPAVHSKSEASWGEPSSPSAAVDNGTSAWGKPPSSGTGWGENPAEPAGTYGRTNAPAAAPALCKPGTHRVTLSWQSRVFAPATSAFLCLSVTGCLPDFILKTVLATLIQISD